MGLLGGGISLKISDVSLFRCEIFPVSPQTGNQEVNTCTR